MTEKAKIYVPVTAEMPIRIKPGSAIVGRQEGGIVDVYYEGNLFGACNLHNYLDRIYVAAGRLFDRAPTVARAAMDAKALVEVGVCHRPPGERACRVEFTNEAAAIEWAEQYEPAA